MDSDSLSATFAALAHPVRRAIVTRLTEGPASVKDLAAPFKLSQPAISKHLKVLEDAGVIVRKPIAQWRPCALAPGAFKEMREWLRGMPRR